jgi:hypothetical protein
MKTQLTALLSILAFLVLVVPFPDSDSVQMVFQQASVSFPGHMSPVPEINPLTDETEPLLSGVSGTGQPDAAGDQPSPYISAPLHEPDSRTVRVSGLEEYQTEAVVAGTAQTAQVTSSDQSALSLKGSLVALSISGNTRPVRQGFGFNDILQKRFPREHGVVLKQPVISNQTPNSVTNSWSLPGNGPSGSLGQLQQPQLENRDLTEPHHPQDDNHHSPQYSLQEEMTPSCPQPERR